MNTYTKVNVYREHPDSNYAQMIYELTKNVFGFLTLGTAVAEPLMVAGCGLGKDDVLTQFVAVGNEEGYDFDEMEPGRILNLYFMGDEPGVIWNALKDEEKPFRVYPLENLKTPELIVAIRNYITYDK